MDDGALCLSLLQRDSVDSWYLAELRELDEDKHKAPTHPRIRPLSLQDTRSACAPRRIILVGYNLQLLHFDRHGDRAATAETEGCQSATAAAPAQFVDQGG